MGARILAASGRVDAVICLGCVIRGETSHYELVAGEAAAGIQQVQLTTGVPVAFGILTTEDEAQALARSEGPGGHNVGEDAAVVAVEMARLAQRHRRDLTTPSGRRLRSGRPLDPGRPLLLRRTTAIAVCAVCSAWPPAAPTTTAVATTTPTTTTPRPPEAAEPLQILRHQRRRHRRASGIDVLVNALAEINDVEVTIVAPAEDQTGTSDTTTAGRRVRTPTAPPISGITRARRSTASRPTRSPSPSTSSASSPTWWCPGSTQGQNVGPLAYLSGTVGAGREAVRRGIPAIAGSAGLTEDTLDDFELAADARSSRYIEEHRAGAAPTAPPAPMPSSTSTCPTAPPAPPRRSSRCRWPPRSPRASPRSPTDCAAASDEAPADDVAGRGHRLPGAQPRPAGGPDRLEAFPGRRRPPPTLDPRAPPRAAQGVAGEAHPRAVRGGRPARRALVDRRLQGEHRRPSHRRGAHPAAPGDPHLRGRGALRPRHRRARLGGGDGQRRHDPRRAPVLEGVEPAVPHRARRAERLAVRRRRRPARRACGCRASTRSSPASSSRSTASRPTSACPTAPPRPRCPTSSTASSTAPRPGRALRAAGLKIIGDVLTSYTALIANPAAVADPAKQHAMEQIKTLLDGVMEARGKVLVKLNVGRDDLDAVIALLPSMKSPTVSELFGEGGYAVETVVAKDTDQHADPRPQGRRRQRHHRAPARQDRPLMEGTVAAFDEPRGLGTIEADGTEYPFHCTAIARRHPHDRGRHRRRPSRCARPAWVAGRRPRSPVARGPASWRLRLAGRPVSPSARARTSR